MTSPPAARISQCSRPTAFCSSSSDRKELEQTSSASPSGLVREGADLGPHLVQHHRHAHLGRLPGRLGPGEAAADDVDRGHVAHGPDLGQRAREGKGQATASRALAGVERRRRRRRARPAPAGRRRWRGSSGTSWSAAARRSPRGPAPAGSGRARRRRARRPRGPSAAQRVCQPTRMARPPRISSASARDRRRSPAGRRRR